MDAINMEVKIKIGDEMIDAKIVMMNGDMIVSPKVVKFEPKDGDVVFSGVSLISIFKKCSTLSSFRAYVALNSDDYILYDDSEYWSKDNLRPATEEEKKKLFDKLAQEGWEWKADTKELVKIKWKPKEGEQYWYPFMCIRTRYSPLTTHWNIGRDRDLLDKGWVFKTEYECQEFCNRLNEAINSVKP